MNRSPFSVHNDFYGVYAFRLFRSMGLRHLPIVDDHNNVVGIITRKDLLVPIIRDKLEEMQRQRRDSRGLLENE